MLDDTGSSSHEVAKLLIDMKVGALARCQCARCTCLGERENRIDGSADVAGRNSNDRNRGGRVLEDSRCAPLNVELARVLHVGQSQQVQLALPVPDAHRVVTGGDDHSWVAGEGDAVDDSVVTPESAAWS